MEKSKTALVLEGGGMRGVFTTGVLNYFMEQQLYFPYVIGVSMGACNAANYISQQPERNKRVNIDYVNDARYLSYLRLLTHGELFGMDFIFNTIPNVLDLFDYHTFYSNKAKCITTVTDCKTGTPLYYEKNELGLDYMKILQASSSLPFIAKPVNFQDRILMDGGLSDSVPIGKSIADGNEKHVLILTQPRSYRKRKEPLAKLAKITYRKLPGLYNALMQRHQMYNDTIESIYALEKAGKVFIIQPETNLPASRVERNKGVLESTYQIGYAVAKNLFPQLLEFIKN